MKLLTHIVLIDQFIMLTLLQIISSRFSKSPDCHNQSQKFKAIKSNIDNSYPLTKYENIASYVKILKNICRTVSVFHEFP